ncbi:MAG: nitroreductase family protein, partial [Deltaproteobacteria bacterium]|nr:nitroreductase family protein [Deltaproteobacteria bacterium]
MPKKGFLPLTNYREYPVDEMKQRASEFYTEMKRRRTVRQFSDRPVPRDIIEDCVCTASTAPSGANMQPWSFVIVSDDTVKGKIREAAEKVEREFYESDSTQTWVKALDHLGTDQNKPFLKTAPYLIVIFSQIYSFLSDGRKKKHYYVTESVGIATGMLIAAVHHAGLASLTYTPSKMRFLNKILSRPSNEKPFMILVVGYPAEDTVVPAIRKKALED